MHVQANGAGSERCGVYATSVVSFKKQERERDRTVNEENDAGVKSRLPLRSQSAVGILGVNIHFLGTEAHFLIHCQSLYICTHSVVVEVTHFYTAQHVSRCSVEIWI